MRPGAHPVEDARMDRHETRYAWNGDVALAYQVVGEGPIDVVYLQGWCSNVDLNWGSPHLSAFLSGMANGRRLIVTDRRGWGCSDRFSPAGVPPIETLTDDLGVVMDEVGSATAVLFASGECAITAILFAATFPSRVGALVLCDPWHSYELVDVDYDDLFSRIRDRYPQPRWWEGPPGAEQDWYENFIRSSIAPGALIAEMRRFLGTDIRPILPSIQAPTLVVADADAPDDDEAGPERSRALAAAIPGARYVDHHRPGNQLNWHHWYGRGDAIVRDVGKFLRTLRAEEEALDRVLATVMFTDIVGSTERAVSLGDRAWRDVAERHHAIVRSTLARYRGTEVDTAGDGFFATFDGPARAIRCAQAVVENVRSIGIEVRAGLHTGELETIDAKAGGLAVVIGARVGALAGPSEVLVSRTVRDLVAGSGLTFDERGEFDLKGVPGTWQLYAVTSR